MPGETREDIDATMIMVHETAPEHFSPATFSPYPGSYLHDYCIEHGLVLDEYATRYIGEAKINGVDYEYIQEQVGNYNSSHGHVKFWLRNSNMFLVPQVRSLYRKLRAKVS